MFDRLLDNEINRTARQPLKRPNPYEIPESISFFQWLKETNDEPTLEELEREKINLDYQQDLINA